MSVIKSYDMRALRIRLIELLDKGLSKSSRFYKNDYESVVRAVNRKTRRELLDALARWDAVESVTAEESSTACKF